MKKNNLLKIILAFIGVMVVLTWIIPTSQIGSSGTGMVIGTTRPLGIWTFLAYVMNIFSFSMPFILLVLVVGGFYSILNATGVYKKLIDKIVAKFKNRKIVFLISSVVLLALITSFTGMPLISFFIFPFIISILIEMEYDRLTIMAATVGSTLVGVLGSTYSYTIAGSLNAGLGLKPQTEIISRLFLLIISLFLLIIYIINNQNKVQLNKSFDDPLYFENKTAKKKLWPMLTITIVTIVIMILGIISWSSEFNISWFQEIYSKIMAFKVFGSPIIANLLGSVPAFGTWSINEVIALIFIATIILVITYKIKIEHAVELFAEGAKKVLPMALMAGFVYIVLFIAHYHPFYLTLMNLLIGLTKSFNIATMIIVSAINSSIMLDVSYMGQEILSTITTLITDASAYSIIAIIIQAVYAITMLLVPTSVMLIIGLMYLQIPYRTWIKYIYKLAVQLLIVLIVMLTIIVLI
jgi:uncharacterized ion transporter superfamily protein YfcC